MKRRSWHLSGVFVAMAFGIAVIAFGEDNPYAPQPQSSLQPMLSIEWKKGPNLPQGFQDASGGVIGHTLITACGFCQGTSTWARAKELDAAKPGCYPRGFLNKAWALDLENPGKGWRPLPNFPGVPRQALMGIAANNAIYYWGGFSYSEPFCYKDGYCLSKSNGAWKWDQLPTLPSPTTGSGICAIGAKIYACGGADYDSERFYTKADRSGGNKRLGSRLLVFDTTNVSTGWKPLAECPGTPRYNAAMAVVRGRIYLIGGMSIMGMTGNVPGVTGDKPGPEYCSVVDNWMFDPASNRWSRLRDLPVSSSAFFSGSIAFWDRYLLLVGGFQFPRIANPDGTLRDKYGVASRFQNKGDFYNDVFVYNTESGLFGTADKLPLNNVTPLTVVREDKVLLLGGETGGSVVEGELYGHHPDLYLVGTIREIQQ